MKTALAIVFVIATVTAAIAQSGLYGSGGNGLYGTGSNPSSHYVEPYVRFSNRPFWSSAF